MTLYYARNVGSAMILIQHRWDEDAKSAKTIKFSKFHVRKFKVVSLYIQHECNKLSVLNLLYVQLNYYVIFYYIIIIFWHFPSMSLDQSLC